MKKIKNLDQPFFDVVSIIATQKRLMTKELKSFCDAILTGKFKKILKKALLFRDVLERPYLKTFPGEPKINFNGYIAFCEIILSKAELNAIDWNFFDSYLAAKKEQDKEFLEAVRQACILKIKKVHVKTKPKTHVFQILARVGPERVRFTANTPGEAGSFFHGVRAVYTLMGLQQPKTPKVH